MISIKKEFFDVDEAAQIIGITFSDIWHLIELGRLDASFRTCLAGAKFDLNENLTLRDVIKHDTTLLLPRIYARSIVPFGEVEIKYANIYLTEPYEVNTIDVFGNETTYLETQGLATFERGKILISKSDLIITQQSIDFFTKSNWYKSIIAKQTESVPRSIKNNERDAMVKIIHALAKNGYKYPSHGSLNDMVKDFQRNSNGVSEKTLKKYLDEFDTL